MNLDVHPLPLSPFSSRMSFPRLSSRGPSLCKKGTPPGFPTHIPSIFAVGFMSSFLPVGYSTGKESIVQVHIEILDENDNPPEFAQPYEPRVCENAPQGKVSLAQVGGQRIPHEDRLRGSTFFHPRPAGISLSLM